MANKAQTALVVTINFSLIQIQNAWPAAPGVLLVKPQTSALPVWEAIF